MPDIDDDSADNFPEEENLSKPDKNTGQTEQRNLFDEKKGSDCADCGDKVTPGPVDLVKEFSADKSHMAQIAAKDTESPSVDLAPRAVPPQKFQPGGWLATAPQQGVDVDSTRRQIERSRFPITSMLNFQHRLLQ